MGWRTAFPCSDEDPCTGSTPEPRGCFCPGLSSRLWQAPYLAEPEPSRSPTGRTAYGTFKIECRLLAETSDQQRKLVAMLKQTATLMVVLASVSYASAQTVTMVNVPTTLEKTVDAKKAKAGDPFNAKTTASTQLSDGTKVPAGSILEGHVDAVTPSEKKSDSTVTVTFDKLQVKNGNEVNVKATLVSAMSTAPTGDDK